MRRQMRFARRRENSARRSGKYFQMMLMGCALACAGSAAFGQISFQKSILGGTNLVRPTTLQFGPDDRLYVGQQDGKITIYDIVKNGPNDYDVTGTPEVINLIYNIPNHDDDGTPNPAVVGRQLTGICVVGTASNPVIFCASSDPRIGGFGNGGDTGLDTNSGIISRVSWNGSAWVKLDLVRGLPRSEENHSGNGVVYDEVAEMLYVSWGGNTNMGAPSSNFAMLPEFALSAAILEVDLSAIGELTYDLPTLNDEDREGDPDLNDPFGGNNGKNQAMLVPGGPVQVYAPGFRNAYDLLITEAGRMYTIDNGPNSGWGDKPLPQLAGACTGGAQEPGVTYSDGLHFVAFPGYYGGHSNPTRANMGVTFNDSNPQSPIAAANPIECEYHPPGSNGSLTTWGFSTNGLCEYTASTFGGLMQGNLIAAGFNGTLQRVVLSADGATAMLVEPLATSVGQQTLDVIAQGDDDPFPGTIWECNLLGANIKIFEPEDAASCNTAYDTGLDEDNDGYSNADEYDNLTDPCSPADVPPDADGDFLSDLNDPDDDNDGLVDTVDPFAVDPDNGTTTSLPVMYTWDNDAPPAGGLLGLGFTGLMTNGTDDYLSQFDPAQMTVGGAAGVLTVDAVPNGDAVGGANTQQYAFQFGIDVGPGSAPFTASTRILAPFAGLTPTEFQSMGLFIGTGDQDNYAKIVISAANGGAIEFGYEINSSFTSRNKQTETLPGPDAVDLFLEVDPSGPTVQPRYQTIIDGVPGPVIDIGGPQALPLGWFDGPYGLAVGIISTSNGPGNPFPATWDFISVETQSLGDPEPSAEVVIDPGNNMQQSSTFDADSFTITNNSSTGVQIEKVTFDLSTSIFPDMVFDPDGTAGDVIGKDFTIDTGEVTTGYTAHQLTMPHHSGFQGVEIDFNNFGPGETFGFSIDADPSSIQGVSAPGPNHSGSVSGLELTGTTVTIEFSDGTVTSGNTYRIPASDTGSKAIIGPDRPGTPALSVLNVTTPPMTLYRANQTAHVTGPMGATVKLLRVEGGLYTDGVPGGGFDIDPFEANSAIAVAEHSATIGAEGFVDIPFTLTQGDDEAGLNHLVAVITDAGDPALTSLTSGTIVLELEPFPDCGADTNGDNTVNVVDLLNVLGDWGLCPTPPDPCPSDVDNDGMIGVQDLLLVLGTWGSCDP